ncbi:MAG: tryptophan--tRNA ligase [Patescibacteria group bacterium]
MADEKKRLLTGLQPSGQLHIGNYFGVLKPFVDMYAKYESFLMVADYHSLTSLKDPAQVRQNTIDVVKDYIAVGVDPTKAVIFKQSDVSEHTEMAWIFECLVTVPFLELSHAYKDKVAKGMEANAGLFNYPMLMAADILLYDTAVVPVGQDQQQHVEYAREAAAKFNNTWGQTFIEPAEMILAGVGTVPGTDGKKMSKSYKNTIPLFGTKEEIAAAVARIVTDSSGEIPQNVYQIHKLFSPHVDALYEANKGKYKQLKDMLVADIDGIVGPMREKRAAITDADVATILADGAAKAKAIASQKMSDVRKKVGVSL